MTCNMYTVWTLNCYANSFLQCSNLGLWYLVLKLIYFLLIQWLIGVSTPLPYNVWIYFCKITNLQFNSMPLDDLEKVQPNNQYVNKTINRINPNKKSCSQIFFSLRKASKYFYSHCRKSNTKEKVDKPIP